MAISPDQGSAGGGDAATITGTNLGGAIAVRFDGRPAVITANTPTSVSVVTPSGTGVADVTVTTGGGTSSPQRFFYLPPPVVLSVSPASGPLVGGTTLTITGRNLSTATSVAFDASTATPTVVSDRQITVVASAGAAGVASLVITTRGGAYSGASFTYAAPPTATSFTPTTSVLAGGVLVSITGTNLATTTGVTFGGTPTTFAVLSPTQVAAIAPTRGIAGAVQVALTTTGGSATAPGTFLYIL
ncbi:IPT/TIG domain-containing protein [Pseudonocardia alaniniphila]|uniref:IPT/TIG domain-containing protein n=1 Tax=Pseudonocardia alaniniphila TaxID=75291 RepID=A0ABS9TE73_9PSEU|nr:IPT/TIG domain-containing protein [Pseudonocardia alaniniphila]MCH6166703.1 IPT/TIG domain-containing protein [Pseudonocardia alaniniphila]